MADDITPVSIVVEKGEVEADATAGAEAIASASVEIAQIEKTRDVELAEIHTASAEKQADTIAEAISADAQKELDECRSNIETLQTENFWLTNRVTELEALVLTLQPPALEQNPPGSSENTQDETPALAESPVEPVKKRKALRWT